MSNMMINNSINQRQVGTMNTPARHSNGRNGYQHLQVGAKPLTPKGHLVRGPILGVRDIVKEVKYVGSGLKGDANDHKLGQINDLAMKAGGLAVAGYLATKRALPAKKGMEFVGAGTFFASMALWPKLFIQAPIQLTQGFNVNQKWEDSIGRTNDFFRDPQYTPWDIMAPEYIEKVGDRMGVDKNMKDRQELVKDKMKKTAIQANTLWMLTAGVATPVMGALIASQLEEPMSKAIEGAQTKKVNKKYANIEQLVKDRKDSSKESKLEKFLNGQKGKKVDDKTFDNILGHLESGDEQLNEAIKKDLQQTIGYKKQEVVSDLFDGILEKGIFKEINVTKEQLEQKLQKHEVHSDLEINKENVAKLRTALGEFWEDDNNKKLNELVEARKTKGEKRAGLKNKVRKEMKAAILDVTADNQATLTPEHINKIKKTSQIMGEYNVRRDILDEYKGHYLGSKEDSIIARRWNRATNKIMKEMGFSTKELDKARTSSTAAYEIMDKKLTDLAKKGNEAKYKSTLGKVANAVREFEQSVHTKAIVNGTKKASFSEHLLANAARMYKNTGDNLRENGFNQAGDYLLGDETKGLFASAEKNYTNVLESTLDGSINSIYKFVHVMDTYKKIANGDIHLQGNADVDVVTTNMKKAALQSRMGDHVVKLHIEHPDDYASVVNNLFGQDSFSKETSEVINRKTYEVQNGSAVAKRLNKMASSIQEDLVQIMDKFHQAHNSRGEELSKDMLGDGYGSQWWPKERGAKNELSQKQARLGETVTEMFKKGSEPLYNTKKWTKMFGGIGIGLATVTLIAPFFFGKIKTSQNNNGGQR